MNPEAIPGAGFAPIRWVGWRTVDAFAELIGRPLEIAEVKLLVQPDGLAQKCVIDDIEFQPVRYAPFVPQTTEEPLKNGTPLAEVELHYGGAFYQNDSIKNGEIIAISGCVYNSRGTHATGSPLIIAAVRLGKILNKRGPVWGECFEHIRSRLQKREAGHMEYRRRVDKVNDVFAFKRRARHGQPLNGGLAELKLGGNGD